MTKTSRRLAIILAAAVSAAALTTTAVLAAGDTDDNISPAGTAQTAASTTNVSFSATIDGMTVTVTCTGSSVSGTTPVSGLGPVTISDPTFSGCTTSLGGGLAIGVNHNNGPWTVTFIDTTNETENPDSAEPNDGDALAVGIPKAGITFTFSALASCTVTAAPSGAASVTGSYDDMSTVKFVNAPIPIAGSGCTTSTTGIINGTYVMSQGFHDVS